jgi:hypothetical protein
LISSFVINFNRLSRDIAVLAYVLVVFLFALIARAVWLIYISNYNELWSLLPSFITGIAALTVTKIADRLIDNDRIKRETERRAKIVQTTHYSIAIIKDLKQKVGYFKKMLKDTDKPAFAYVDLAKSIQERYDALHHIDLYIYLPGRVIEILGDISANIYGIGIHGNVISQLTQNGSLSISSQVPRTDESPLIEQLEKADKEIGEMLDEIYKLRNSLDTE